MQKVIRKPTEKHPAMIRINSTFITIFFNQLKIKTMKKLMIILIAALSFNASSAQSRNDSHKGQDRYQVNQTKDNRYNNDQGHSNDYAYNKSNNYNNSKSRNDDHNRQAEYDRMNQQYDQRVNGYRNDRSLNTYERDRRINEAEQERQQKSKGFGGGLIVGGIAGVLLGLLIGH